MKVHTHTHATFSITVQLLNPYSPLTPSSPKHSPLGIPRLNPLTACLGGSLSNVIYGILKPNDVSAHLISVSKYLQYVCHIISWILKLNYATN